MGDDLRRVLAPRSVAVLGASEDALKPGGKVIDYMKRHRFAGDIYPVSLNRTEVQGIRAYADLADLPGVPDLVVIALAEAHIAQALEACATAGAAGAVIFASGYAELGEAGRAQQADLTRFARASGVRLIGPNTQGLANFATGAVAHFGTIIDQLPTRVSPVGIVSQSGAGSQILYARLHEVGIGAKYLVATGNEADVDVGTVALAYAQDPDVELILVYAESIQHPARLARAAELARRRGVPILMVKAGRTQSGQRTAASHTGALASEDRLVDAFLEHHGILRLGDFEEMARTSQVFLRRGHRVGRRVASISNSGATCVLSADAIEDAGLELATFDAALCEGLRGVLPAFISAGNPVDMTTATLKNPRLFAQVLEQIHQHEGADLVHVGFPIGGKGYDLGGFADDLRQFVQASGATAAVSVNQDWVTQAFLERGIPVFGSERAAVGALAALARWQALTGERSGGPGHALAESPGAAGIGRESTQTGVSAPALADAASAATTGQVGPGTAATRVLSEAQSLAELAAAGLPVVRHHVCQTPDDAVAAWQALGGAEVVVKGVSASVAHKSEHGLVRVGLASEAAVREAAQAMLATLHTLQAAAPAILVAERMRADVELVLGGHVDPAFGPMVAIGHGGVLVELMDDVQFVPAPCTPAQALRRLQRLHVARVFPAARGLPAIETQRLVDLIVRFGDHVAAQATRLHSIDINPVLVRRGPHDPVIVDALVVQEVAS